MDVMKLKKRDENISPDLAGSLELQVRYLYYKFKEKFTHIESLLCRDFSYKWIDKCKTHMGVLIHINIPFHMAYALYMHHTVWVIMIMM